MTRLTHFTVVAVALVAAAACGGNSVTRTINAGQGGTIETASSKLDIPADALSEDTSVSLSVSASVGSYPALSDAREVVTIEPAGTLLQKPATIEITPRTALAQGDVATIYQLVEGRWAKRSAQQHSGGAFSVQINRFAPLALVVEAGPTPTAGVIEGSVFDSKSERPVAELDVVLLRSGKEIARTSTDAKGAFRFTGVAPGEVTVRHEGDVSCDIAREKKVTVEAEKTVKVFLPACSQPR